MTWLKAIVVTIITITLLCIALVIGTEYQRSTPGQRVVEELFKAPTPPRAPVIQRAPTVTAYNGLIYAEMDTLVRLLRFNGAKVKVLWHDQQETDTACPDYIIGHSMGGNAALRQAVKCQAEGRAPKGIVSIDAGRAPLTFTVPKNAQYTCVSFYNSAHPIGGQYIAGKCTNVVVKGYDHLYMPSAPAVVRGVMALVFPAQTQV